MYSTPRRLTSVPATRWKYGLFTVLAHLAQAYQPIASETNATERLLQASVSLSGHCFGFRIWAAGRRKVSRLWLASETVLRIVRYAGSFSELKAELQ